MRTATIIGSIGLIGSYLTDLLLQDEYYDKVRLIVRRPVDRSSPKLEIKLISFENPEDFRSAIDGSQAVFSAIGTTQAKVKGDREAYRKIDYDIAVNASGFAKDTGCSMFSLVSSAGADPHAKNFYLKLKGEIEEAVKQNGPESICIFRPSMLMGKRKETRIGETIGKILMTTFSFLIPTKYKIIHAERVAKAMVKASKSEGQGVHYFDYASIE